MPIARSRLEIQQVLRLLHLVREHDGSQIEKLVGGAIPFLVNYNEVRKTIPIFIWKTLLDSLANLCNLTEYIP